MEVDGKRLDDDIVSELCEPCQEGNVSTQADGYCNDCEEYMCQACFQNHVKMKVLRNHVLGALDGEKSQVTKKLEEKCKQHTSENMKYYCRNHDFVGCGDCIISDHRQCEPKFIKDLATNFEESSEYKTLLKRTQEWDAVKTEAENRIERDRKLNNILVYNAVKGMRNFRKEINDWLNKMETRLEEEVKKISNSNEIQISKQEKNIKSVSEKMDDLKEELNPNVNTGDKLFIRTVECKPKICDIDKAVSEIKSGYVITSYTFEPETKIREMLASSVELGIIKLKCKKSEKKQTAMVESSATDIDKLPDPPRADFEAIRRDALSQEMPEFQNVDLSYCVICKEELENPKTLKCGHLFCTDCIAQHFKFSRKCPACGLTCGIITDEDVPPPPPPDSEPPSEDPPSYHDVQNDDEQAHEPEREPSSELEREPSPVPVISKPQHNFHPRKCHIRNWPDFQGYGFDLYAEKKKKGQYIGLVDANSPAEDADLRKGDRLIEVNGENIEDVAHAQVIQKIKAGGDETILLVVDPEADEFYKNNGIKVTADLPEVIANETRRKDSTPDATTQGSDTQTQGI